MSKKGDYKIPFDKNGNMEHYPEFWAFYADGREWRENEPFDATLTFDGWTRGRSAAYFYWKDADGHRYPMFMSDLTVLLTQNVVEYGVVSEATWIGVKRGQNYGIALAGT